MKSIPKQGPRRAAAPITLLIPALALAFLASCGGGGKTDAGAAAMTVNGVPVSREQIDEFAELYRAQQMRRAPESVFEGGGDDMRAGAARQVAGEMLMLEVVRAMGWRADPARIDAVVQNIFGRMGADGNMLETLARMGETEESMRKSIEEGLLLDSLMKAVSDAGPISEDEMLAFYETNRDRFASPKRVRGSHIIFAFNPNASEPDQAETLLKRANEALERAKKGENFDSLVRAYSAMPDNGDMGWFKPGELSADLENALFALKKGEVSGLAPSAMGIHIIKKTDEQEGRQMPFGEVTERVGAMVETEKRGKRIEAYLDSLIAAADIKYIDPTLAPKPKY